MNPPHESLSAARLPPPELDGLDPAWSRLVHVPSIDGVGRTFHLLDSHPDRAASPDLTLLCVHGNPSWSYLWRRLVARAAATGRFRVIAPDQLGMGWSERTGPRLLADRVDDLRALTDELGLADRTVVTVAHDWGGPISLVWALAHRSPDPGRLAGVVLTNTAVHQPTDALAPAVIRLVRSRAMLRRVTRDSTAFIRGAIAMSRPQLSADVAAALLAPYSTAERRTAIERFVADIPLEADHPSFGALDDIARGLDQLADTPALLLWGGRDPVFSGRYLRDLEQRLPHAQVQRWPDAGHFVPEDADIVTAIDAWLDGRRLQPERPAAVPSEFGALWNGIDSAAPEAAAVVEMGDGARSVSFAELGSAVDRWQAGLQHRGIVPGARVGLMIPPGFELTAALYGCWRHGVVTVLIDAGLGPRGMDAAVRSAGLDHLVGIPRALRAARALGWSAERHLASEVPRPPADGFVSAGAGAPDAGEDAAVVFTSGATGPSKGVRYTHGALQAQRDAIRATYGIGPDDRLVAAFAPFALYGPALGITSAVPDMDITAPGTLTAEALADAVAAVDATLVFASPAALANVVATSGALSPSQRNALGGLRLVLSAGAPVRSELLRQVRQLTPAARLHTPYGMTECLPVADVSLDELDEVGSTPWGRDAGERAVCVGRPIAGVEVKIAPFDDPSTLVDTAGVAGEIVVRAPHQRAGYHRLHEVERRSSTPPGWHRTGDVGFVEHDRLWVGGRLGHVIDTESGPVMPVGIEAALERLTEVEAAAAIGVGPPGLEQIVAVVTQPQSAARHRRAALASTELGAAVRGAVDLPIAAVLVVPTLPVDRRHNSKIDRSAIAKWAGDVLAGGRMRRLA